MARNRQHAARHFDEYRMLHKCCLVVVGNSGVYSPGLYTCIYLSRNEDEFFADERSPLAALILTS